jgi:hypothetical protein
MAKTKSKSKKGGKRKKSVIVDKTIQGRAKRYGVVRKYFKEGKKGFDGQCIGPFVVPFGGTKADLWHRRRYIMKSPKKPTCIRNRKPKNFNPKEYPFLNQAALAIAKKGKKSD